MKDYKIKNVLWNHQLMKSANGPTVHNCVV